MKNVQSDYFDIEPEAFEIEVQLAFADGDRQGLIKWIEDGRPLTPGMKAFLLRLINEERKEKANRPRTLRQITREREVINTLNLVLWLASYGHFVPDEEVKPLGASPSWEVALRLGKAAASRTKPPRGFRGKVDRQICKVYALDASTLQDYKKRQGYKPLG